MNVAENLFHLFVLLCWLALITCAVSEKVRYAAEEWVGEFLEKYKHLFGYAWQYSDGKKDISFLKKNNLMIIPFESFAKKHSVHYTYSKEDDAFEIATNSGKGILFFNSRKIKILVLWPCGAKLGVNQKIVKNLTGILISEQEDISEDRFFKRGQVICLDYASAQK